MKKEFGNFTSLENLHQWLLTQSIDLDRWNCGQAKSVSNLYNEIVTGESSIQLQPPLRVLKVVQVLVRNAGKYLLELGQELDDKRLRTRNILPSEKMKPGEDCLIAASRCLVEELQIQTDRIKILTKQCKPVYRYRNSRSYPGLRTKYVVYRVEVTVKDLPTDDFWTDEISNQGDIEIIRRHYWGWETLKKIKYPD
jgi:hypothetical protein